MGQSSRKKILNGWNIAILAAVISVAVLGFVTYRRAAGFSPEQSSVSGLSAPGQADNRSGTQAGPALGQLVPAAALDPAPDIAFKGADGQALSLLNYRGKLVVLNLWATWCGPCVQEMPSLERLQQAMGSDGFVVLPISEDPGGADTVRQFFASQNITGLPILTDAADIWTEKLNLIGLPTTLLISPAGKVLGKIEGVAQWDDPVMINVLKKLMREAPPTKS